MKLTDRFILLPFAILMFFAGMASAAASISGFVTDSTSGEGLFHANVYLENEQIGISTNEQGYYVLHPVPPGDHILKVAYLGYHTTTKNISVTRNQKIILNVALMPEAVEGEEIIVSAEALTREREINLSKVELSVETIRQGPQLGEADLFRTLQALPGVVATSDFSTGLVVRGGNTDQNLIMLDGITVYNPSHLGGLFSNFLLDATKDAQFIKGGFPAEYGGRMSSVLNVISKSGNNKHFDGAVGISLLSSRLSLEVPVANGSLLLAGRRTYFDKVLALTGQDFPYYFYDFQGSFYQDISPYDRISITGYFGNDVLDWDELSFDINWGNRTFAANWRHVFSPQLFSNFMVAASHFEADLSLGGDQGVKSKNDVIDYTVKGDLSYLFSTNNTLKFGFEYKKLQFEFLNEYDERTQFQLLQRPSEVGFYVQDNWRLNSRWILKPGIRVSYFTEDENEFYFEPRFSAKYKLRDGEYLTYATGIYRQFIFTVQDEYNPSIINNWFAVDETVEAGFSIHNIIGYEKELWTTTTLQLEFYHKTLDNMLTYRETRSAVDEDLGTNVRAIDFFVPTDGYSYGMEVFLHKKYGRLAGWIGYTLNWARQTIEGETFNASFDRRNNLDILMSYDLGKNWRFSMQFNYGTGFPFTRVEGSYLEVDGSGLLPRRRLLYGDRFAFRLPAYHRMDFGFSKYFKWWNMDWRLDLQMINAYNRENVFFYEWDFDKNPAERTVIPMLPIVPSIGISTEF